MPCYDGGYPQTSDNAEIKKIHKLTRLLCEACTELDAQLGADENRFDEYMSKELQAWWKAHQKADKEREAKEAKDAQKAALRKQLLMSFSSEEKEALGIR